MSFPGKKIQLHHKSPRQDIVTVSYYIRIEYKNIMDSFNPYSKFKEYDKSMKKYMKEEILDKLLVYIEGLSDLGGEESNKKK